LHVGQVPCHMVPGSGEDGRNRLIKDRRFSVLRIGHVEKAQHQEHDAENEHRLEASQDSTCHAVQRVELQRLEDCLEQTRRDQQYNLQNGEDDDEAESRLDELARDRKSTRLNSSHVKTSYAVI